MLDIEEETNDYPSQCVIGSIETLVSRITLFGNINDSKMRLTSFIDNFIITLFGDHFNNDPHASNRLKSERKFNNNEEGSDIIRPDYKINVLDQNGNCKYTNLFGEIKTADQVNNNKRGHILDLYRIVAFGKEEAEKEGLKHIMVFQLIGSYLTFYLLEQQENQDINTDYVLELCKIIFLQHLLILF